MDADEQHADQGRPARRLTGDTSMGLALMPLGLRAALLALALALGILLTWRLGSAPIFASVTFLSGIHTLFEIFAILVALLIFAVGWTSAGPPRARSTVVLACAFLAVGLLDLLHALSHAGIPGLITVSNQRQAIFFWQAARLVSAAALLKLVVCECASPAGHQLRSLALTASIALVALAAWLGLWRPDLLPTVYSASHSLDLPLPAVELLIIGLLLAATALLIVRRRISPPFSLGGLLASLITLIASDLAMAGFVAGVEGLNLLAHSYKVLAYLFLYRALFRAAIAEPYRQLLQARDLLAREQTALRDSESRLREREERLSLVLDGSNDGFWDWNIATGAVIYSARWVEMLGYTLDEIPPSIEAWERLLHPDDREHVQQILDDHLAGRTERYEAEQRLLTRSGEWRWILDRGRVTARDEHGRPLRMAGTHTDVTDRHQIEESLRQQQIELQVANEQLQALATTDGLTGLVNHRALQERLVAAMRLASRSGRPLSLIMLDIDHFKRFNDTFGHLAGDNVLRVVGGVLRASVRLSDTVARYGGEEFALLLQETDNAEATEIAERCRHAVAALVWADWAITASFGVATWDADDEGPQDLIAAADRALYRAKEDGRNRVIARVPIVVRRHSRLEGQG